MPSTNAHSVTPASLDAQIERLNEAARWLEEHTGEDRAQRSGTFLLPPTVVRPGRRNYALKRVFDVIVSGIAIILLSPVLAAVALAVRLDSKGPSLFKQERIGRYGKPFRVYKFRSMRTDANDAVHRAAIEKFMQGQQIGDANNAYKLERDPRITRVGGFIRATSLDELPQLFNILKGEMSLVGPRPALRYEVDQYRYRHRYRLLVTPGLTGIWQVYGRSKVDFETLVSMDLHYVTDGSIWLDLKLILLTFGVVFGRSGGK